MESWRFLVAVVLMIAVVVVTNLLFPPPPPPPQEATRDTAAVEAVEPDQTAVAPETVTPSPPAAATALEEPDTAAGATPPADTLHVESPLYRYALTTDGAALLGAELLGYESFTHEGPVQLAPLDSAGHAPVPFVRYGLRVGERTLDLSGIRFEASARGVVRVDSAGGAVPVTYTGRVPGGLEVRLEYTFHPGSYLVDVRGQVTGAGRAPVWLVRMGPRLGANEANLEEERRALAYVVNGQAEGIRRVALDKVSARRVEEGPLWWAAFKSKYFVAAVVAADEEDAGLGGLIAEPAPGDHTADLTVTLPDADGDGDLAYRLYLGPQASSHLAAVGHEFSDVNPIGWRIFRPIISPLAHLITWALVGLHQLLGLGYGWVLIVFGVLVRVLLWPLNAKAMRAQLKNMEVQPLLKEVQARYKNEPEKLQKEMLRLYREEGFSPMGGCLPMLVPFPVLLTLFFVFQNTIEFRGVEFLWLPDLSRPDPFYILPVLLGVSMFVLQWISMRSTPQTNPQMKMMMYLMPPFMVVIFLNLASGLNLYYAASNVATVPQQMLLMKERKAFHNRKAAREEPAPPEPVAPAGPRQERRRDSRKKKARG